MIRRQRLNKVLTLATNKNDREYLGDIQQQEEYEKMLEGYIRKKFKTEYTDFNVNINREKQQSQQKQFHARKQERFNFFPFTEGESVEQKRAEQKKLLNKELRERSRQIDKMPGLLSDARKTRDKSNGRMQLKSDDFSPANTSRINALFSPPESAPNGNKTFYQGNEKDIVNAFNKSYPKFLEPHKHYPYRRLKDTHVEKVMQDAVKRVEDQVKDIEDRRLKQSTEFQKKFEEMLRTAETHNFIRQKDAKTLQEYQVSQIQEKEKLNNFYHNEERNHKDAYYGPKEKGIVVVMPSLDNHLTNCFRV